MGLPGHEESQRREVALDKSVSADFRVGKPFVFQHLLVALLHGLPQMRVSGWDTLVREMLENCFLHGLQVRQRLGGFPHSLIGSRRRLRCSIGGGGGTSSM